MNTSTETTIADATNAITMPLARVTAYALGDTASPMGMGPETLEAAVQRDGSVLWAIRRMGGSCLNKKGEWEYEPMPSSRTAAFFKRCRWPTAEAAYQAWEAVQTPKVKPTAKKVAVRK